MKRPFWPRIHWVSWLTIAALAALLSFGQEAITRHMKYGVWW